MERRDPLTTNVIACKWRRTADGWRLWVKGRPDVAGEGATYEIAHERLIDAVCAAAPDLDSVIPMIPEFDPPLPASACAEPYLHPELYLISGEEFCELHGPTGVPEEHSEQRRADLESLFDGGICPVCRHGRGARTQVPMWVDGDSLRVDVGYIRAPFFDSVHIFSERFLALLSAEERGRLDFRPVQIHGRARRQYFELRGRPGTAFVGVRGLESDGLECPECGHRSLRVVHPHLMEGEVYMTQFVCDQDLPSPLEGCFTVGAGNDVWLCMTRSRRDALRGYRHARGASSTRLGVVQIARCERKPRICNHRGFCEVCAKWPAAVTVDNQKQAVFDRPATACSQRNLTWLNEAEHRGEILVSQATVEPLELWNLAQREEADARTEFISLRCPNCWRLGWIVLTSRKLKLLWSYGLW